MHQEKVGQQDFLLTFWTEESIFIFSRCRHHAAQIVESNELKGTTFYLGYSKVTKLLIVGNVVSWLSGIIMACSNYCSSGTLWFRRCSSFSEMLENVAGPLSFLSAQQWLTRPGAFRGRFAPLCAFSGFLSCCLFEFTPVLFLWTEVPLAQKILSISKWQREDSAFCAIVNKIFKHLLLLVMRATFSVVVVLAMKALWSQTCL